MIRYICLAAVLCILFRFADAQSILPLNEKTYTDSLVQVLQKAANDSVKARTHYLLADYWRLKDTVQSRAHLNQAHNLATRYPKLRALYPFYEGQFYFSTNQQKAAALFLQATKELAPYHDAESYLVQSMAWFNYGIMSRNEKGDAFVMDTWLNKAIPLAEKSGNEEKLAHYYGQLATVFMYNAQFDKAEIYNDKAIQLLEVKYPSSTTLMQAYLSAASNFIYNKKNQQARQMLDKAQKMLEPYPESVNHTYYYYNEGLYYTAVNAFDKALLHLDKGIVLARKYNQAMLLQLLFFRKYNILFEQKKYAPARDLLLSLLQEGTLSSDVNNRKTIYQYLASTYAAMGTMGEAYKWSVKYYQLSDSLHESNLKTHMNELEIKYHNAENEKRIAMLEAEKTKASLAARNQRLINWLLGISLLFLLIVAFFAWLYYRNSRKLQAQKELNYLQQLKEAEQQKQLQVSEAMLQGEEQERERVARDLHDGLGGVLAGMKISLSSMLVEAPQPAEKELHRIVEQLDYSSNELRRIVRNMMPEALLKFGLETALRELCLSMSTATTTIHFQPFGIQPSLPKQTQVTIYRVVQELLSNALKHAGATSIILQCTQSDDVFFITSEDNGRGFNTGLIDQFKGVGLSNIRKRVDYLKGKMEIETAPEEGTTINIELHVAG